MKNEVTFQIEQKQLSQMIQDKKFEDADLLCTRMLNDYNKLDYELLLKRARIRQCLMKYEEAALDANFALHVLPQRLDAYYVLSDFLVALNNYSEALKLLEILYHHDPNDPIIKSQYSQIKEKEKKKQQKSITKIQQKCQKQQEQRQQSKQMFQQAQKYLEDIRAINQPEEERKSSIMDQLAKIKEEGLVMSDEMLEDSENEIQVELSEKPGNAQHLETPRVQQQIDFRLVNFEEIFGKKKEVYKMKPEKLSVVDCQLCQLVFDYTSTCQHFSQLNQDDIEDLKTMMPGIAGNKDMSQRKQALQKVTRSLDVLSTFKVTSLTLLQGQFSEIIVLYLKRDLSILLGEFSEFICGECCCVQKDAQNKPQVTLAQHALIIVNRSLTFQQQALMLNQKEDLINIGGLEEEKSNFKFEPRISTAIIDEIKIELEQSANKPVADLNFQTLHLLARAIANLMILSQEQIPLMKLLEKHQIIKRFLSILYLADSSLLQDKASKAPQFCLFVTHCFRLFILCQSIEQNFFKEEDEPSLRQVLRKYELYDKAFPLNSKLINALKGDILWFKHSNQGCHMKNFYKDLPQRICGNCSNTSRDLKACSRCLKVYYCNRDCQKSHYPQHKALCTAAK